MINPDPTHVMFIEPTKTCPEEMVYDEYTERAAELFRDAKPHSVVYKGIHTCACGMHSDNKNWVLKDGRITNSLLVHYVRDHRSEVPQAELDKLIPPEQQPSVGPTNAELVELAKHSPPSYEWLDGDEEKPFIGGDAVLTDEPFYEEEVEGE